MKNKDIERRLKREIEALTPDVFDAVCAAELQESGDVITFKPKSKSALRHRMAGMAVAACAALAIALGGLFYTFNAAADSNIAIDVNPSIQIVTNRRDKVIAVNALNDDAKTVLGDMELKNTSLEVTVNALVGSLVRNGYISEAKNAVLVTVENKDAAKAGAIRERVDSDITAALESMQIKPIIVSQTADSAKTDETVSKQAEDSHISYGKALMISRLREKYPELKTQALEGMSTTEIVTLLRSLGIRDYEDIIYVDDPNEPYCDDCGKLNSECRKGVCADNGDYCEKCGKPEGSCVHTQNDNDDDDDDDDDDRLPVSNNSVSQSSVNITSAAKDNDKDDDDDDDDDDDGPYCDDCGKLLTECRKGVCADNGDYCEKCGKPEGKCLHTLLD